MGRGEVDGVSGVRVDGVGGGGEMGGSDGMVRDGGERNLIRHPAADRYRCSDH